jgi:RNA polymerase sigma-70 factor, ECF subfamily
LRYVGTSGAFASEDQTGEAPVSELVLAKPSLSFRELAEAHVDFVFRSLRRAGLDVTTAEDATQQVFLIVARKLDCIEHGHERGFLYATAKNVAAQYRKRALRLGEVAFEEEEESLEPAATLGGDDPPSLDELLDQRHARGILDEVLAAMPEKLREVFVLSELEGLTAPEVSACLEIPLGTAASRLRRAREVFDAILGRVRAQRSFRRGTP